MPHMRLAATVRTAVAFGVLALAGGFANAQQPTMTHQPGMAHPPGMTHPPMAASPSASASASGGAADGRVPVAFPAPMGERLLANMRDHLLAIQEINAALAKDDTNAAAKIAEERLGMTALERFESHETAQYMPPAMQAAGAAMHRGASRFAIAVQDADVTGDLKPALGALAETMQACVTCHAGFRLK